MNHALALAMKHLSEALALMFRDTHMVAVISVACVLFVAFLVAGCSTAPTEREIIAAYELVGFDWCSPAELHQCAMIRDRNQMFLMPTPSRYGDETMNLYNRIGATVDAFSEDE